VIALAVGVIALATATVGLAAVVKSGRMTRHRVAEVHVLVNHRLDEALDDVDTLTTRVSQLETSITDRGQPIPPAPE
jgi:hypothetical protein